MSVGRVPVKPPTKRRCKNCTKFFAVNPSRPDEKKYCSDACRMDWNKYGANDMVRQREFIVKYIERELALIRKELGLPAQPTGESTP